MCSINTKFLMETNREKYFTGFSREETVPMFVKTTTAYCVNQVIIAGKPLFHTKRLRSVSNGNTSHAASAKGLKLKSALTLSGPKSSNY